MSFNVLKALWSGLFDDPRSRARTADLVQLPPNIEGTNCGNCRYIENVVPHVDGTAEADCIHPLVRLRVSSRDCCSYWDAPGVVRVADLEEALPGLGQPIDP